MAKKKSVKRNVTGTFEVRLVAPGLLPEKIPLHAVSEVLSAVQYLACGRDPFEQPQVPVERGIGLVDVREGSAVYCCLSRTPEDALSNLSRVGQLLSAPEDHQTNGDLISALQPIRSLSDVAKSVGCRVEVTTQGRRRHPLFVVQQDDYERISRKLFIRGETTIVGTIKRVGGATSIKCALRVPGRRLLLYCDVKDKNLVRRLGEHLYEQIVATGTACWIHRSWRLYEFTINDFTQPHLGDPIEAIEAIRHAGLSAWDRIEDPKGYIEELRS